MLKIGIDCGTHTGFAVWDVEFKQLVAVQTLMIHEALFKVRELAEIHVVELYVENPNTWKPFEVNRKVSDAKLQGAGSIKRDFAIWEDFANNNGIKFVPTKIQGAMKKLKPEVFTKLTGWTQRTSEHARDAAMIVYKCN